MMFAVYACIFRTELAGSKYDCGGRHHRRADESFDLLYEYFDESDDAFFVFVMVTMSFAQQSVLQRSSTRKADIVNPENSVKEVTDGSIVFDDVKLFPIKKTVRSLCFKILTWISNLVKPLALSEAPEAQNPALSI